MSEEELAREIAVLLFQQGKLTLAQASRLAGMSRLQFQHLLASRQIPVHYDALNWKRTCELCERFDWLDNMRGEKV